MVEYTIDYDDKFKKTIKKLDQSVKIKVKKQIKKIVDDPKIGKPMRNVRKGTREVYVKPYRLSYYYSEDKKLIVFLDFYHKDKQ
ncbi:MAG: type II toxin-antitoxin system RelE/ParE family toxin [Methanobrevibacter sp.]|uniref:type II toxin-antitoxin system RelE family toxin n=1 Tax=Methanobrevibacter sp. TaxID=66852 RepID=UPI0025D99237|nr:type II toxin-antitoxin system RelE/ParE family toxin [Methanobrevibacter sp.]MBR0271429.1 type II toxin-antitoxin system RelE/ParE family toxin [Methanobrevibacter sp.]